MISEGGPPEEILINKYASALEGLLRKENSAGKLRRQAEEAS